MTPTTKRHIAREWLIFLAAITLGLLITYGVFYLGRNVTWTLYSQEPIPEYQRWLVDQHPYKNYLGEYGGTAYSYSKPKNPGDFFNDLWPIVHTYYSPRRYVWDEKAVKLWLCVLGPYLVFCFVRSIIWSVNTLRRP